MLCPSIFERKIPLADKTLKRIARGIQKFVVDNPQPFVLNYKYNNEPEDAEKPLSTITSVNSHYMVAPMLSKYHGPHGDGDDYARGQTVDKPIRTVDTSNRFAMIEASLISRQFGKSTGHDMGSPLGTVTAGGGGKSQLVTTFLSKYYGGNYKGAGADVSGPAPTVTSKDHNALVSSHIIKLKGDNIGHAADQPLQTITAGGLHFGEVRAFLLKYYGQGTGQDINDPLGTVTTKDRFGIVTIQGEEYQIADIGMRMLTPRELFDAQGFPHDYIIDRGADGRPLTKAAQVAKAGNAVPPQFSCALVKANLPELCTGANTTERHKYAPRMVQMSMLEAQDGR